jgi:MOSC domain-containing protein YiiM
MWQGTIIAIGITRAGGERISAVDRVTAVAGQGLQGDRYFEGEGSFSGNSASGRQITLIEAEAVEALERDYGYKLDYIDARRNIVTRGVPLNHLVGKEFRVGEATLRGVRLSEPCHHLAGLTSDKVKVGLIHRGGLRADIVGGGLIRVGDEVTES